MPSLSRPDLSLHYEIDGDGPPLVLIAGMMSDSASWGPITPDLASAFTVIRPDNRTTGRTIPATAPASLDLWAHDIVALLDNLGTARAHVAGHSLGGLIGLHLAALAPDRVDRLALLAAAPLFLPRNLHLFRHFLALRGPDMPPDLWLRGLFPWLFHPEAFDDPAAIDTMVALSLGYPHGQGPTAMAAQIEAFASTNEQLHQPRKLPPTRAILAEDDLLMPLGPARAALVAWGINDIVQVAHAGHSVHWDAPAVVSAALLTHFGKETEA